MTSRRKVLSSLGAIALAPALVRAQLPMKRVCALGRGAAGDLFAYWQENFPKEFEAHGFFVGRNLQLEFYSVGSAPGPTTADLRARAREVVAEMLATRPDCLVTQAEPGTRFLQQATRTIPIVTDVGDPVASGFAQTLARPGGNITGLHQGEEEAMLKTVEMLKRVMPTLSCVAWVGTDTVAFTAERLERCARKVGIKFHRIVVDTFEPSRELATRRELAAMRREGCAAVQLNVPGGKWNSKAWSAFAREQRLALIGGVDEDDFLVAYNAKRLPEHRSVKRIPAIVARILRGDKPGDIPFEGPSSYMLIVNLRVASQLGLTVPPDVMLLAEQVIR